jgi:hypothetical protein
LTNKEGNSDTQKKSQNQTKAVVDSPRDAIIAIQVDKQNWKFLYPKKEQEPNKGSSR